MLFDLLGCKWKVKTIMSNNNNRTCVPASLNGDHRHIRVYLSVDCQQKRYWDGTVADVHKDILYCLNTERHKVNKGTVH